VDRAAFQVFYVLVFGVFVTFVVWSRVRRWYKHTISQRWPMVPAKFEQGGVQKVVRQSGRTSYECFELSTMFSYKANEEVYDGEYLEDFQNLSEAQQLLRSLKNGPLYVRYHPTKPWEYVLDPYRDVRPE
jgi:hypothetical protein